ncbi:YitT family protein [Faecalicatena contorta]|uniref:YitT family protein n=1 Tax=Faecalicatena contorta TaxID=39482 RepID=UPI001F3B9DDB|nr:YitT family protein [Faecalicatena contorta]MCF2679615.1 YitT family protein [Faecalicatena contorta]
MKQNWGKHLYTVMGVLIGNIILAFTVAAFMVPHGIIMGGATGIGLTISHYVPIALSSIVFVVNGVLFLLGAFTLGKKFIVTTIMSTFLYPAFLSVMQAIPGIENLTDNIMLAMIYGGGLLGLGVGIIVRVGSSTGGTDILALVFNKWFHVSVAVLMYIVDFIVLGAQAMFSDAEQIMYGILTLILETFVLNRVMLLGQSQIQLFVISDRYEEIRKKMLIELDAGVTMVHIETGFGREAQKGVLCIIPKRKLYSVKELIHSVDPKAFITITQINEVRGRGFTMDRVKYHEITEEGKNN